VSHSGVVGVTGLSCGRAGLSCSAARSRSHSRALSGLGLSGIRGGERWSSPASERGAGPQASPSAKISSTASGFDRGRGTVMVRRLRRRAGGGEEGKGGRALAKVGSYRGSGRRGALDGLGGGRAGRGLDVRRDPEGRGAAGVLSGKIEPSSRA